MPLGLLAKAARLSTPPGALFWRKMPKPIALAALFAVGLSGCVGAGTGTASGSIYVEQCTVSGVPPAVNHPLGSLTAQVAYDLRPSYFVAAPTLDADRAEPMNKVIIREQSENSILSADLIELSVANVRLVADALGQPITVGPATNVRADLRLNHTCTQDFTGLELDGTITFSRFGATASGAAPADFAIYPGDPLTASFQFDVVDRRALTLGGVGGVAVTPQVAGHLDGSFDFHVKTGPGAQEHP